jgi:hypothetical protein
MQWTFGIITGGGEEQRIGQIVDSIEAQGIASDDYEILVVGDCWLERKNLRVLPFDETIKPLWITRKKNLLAEQARFANLCLFHDYIKFLPGWYENFCTFGGEWDVCMNPILNAVDTRYRDWVTWDPIKFVPYDNHNYIRQMYVSGAYFCVKKQFMLANPLDERLVWNEGEDVEWSCRVRGFWNYRCNPNSIVQTIKQKEWVCVSGWVA